jgi:hypothetical protein
MTYILHGLQFQQPITFEAKTVDECISEAARWMPAEDSQSGVGLAAPLNITDADGTEIMDRDTLIDKTNEMPHWLYGD